MGFDKHSDGPIVNPHKKTTQVNIWMVIGIVVFFLITGLLMARFVLNPNGPTRDVMIKQAESAPEK